MTTLQELTKQKQQLITDNIKLRQQIINRQKKIDTWKNQYCENIYIQSRIDHQIREIQKEQTRLELAQRYPPNEY